MNDGSKENIYRMRPASMDREAFRENEVNMELTSGSGYMYPWLDFVRKRFGWYLTEKTKKV
jgi:hypothetical protein